IDQLVAFELGTTAECLGDQIDREVPALARASVAGMACAIVNDVQRQRRQLPLECGPKLLAHVAHVEASPERSSRGACRMSNATCASPNTNVRLLSPKNL